MNRTFVSTSGSHLARAECDANGHWSVEFLLEGTNVRCLAADPLNPNIVYAGTQGSGVLRSTDRGKTWQPSGMDGRIVKSIAVSAAQPDLIYAGTKPPGVFVSRDGGQHWNELASFQKVRGWWWFTPAETPFNHPYVQGIALSPTDPNVVLAGVELGAVLRSEDGGETWQKHRKGAMRDCHSITFHASNGDWAYEGGGSGAGGAVSRDGGKTWTQTKQGVDRTYGWAAAADAGRPDLWYVSRSPGPFKAHVEGKAEAFIYRKSGDSAWEKLTGGLPQPLMHMPYALIPDRAASGRLYAGLSNGDVWYSADCGDHWQQLPVNMGSVWTAMIML